MDRRRGRWVTWSLLAVLAACDSGADPGPVPVSMDSSPIRVMTGPTVEDVAWFTALDVVPGDRWWSGLTTVEVTQPIEVSAARMLTGEGIDPVAVLIGRNHEDGLPGAMARVQPGADRPGHPRPAAGYELEPGVEYVVYLVARLSDGPTTGEMYGAELDVGGETFVVVSPTVLCTDPDPSEACAAAEQRTSDRTADLLGA